jgi:hypothetical protein
MTNFIFKPANFASIPEELMLSIDQVKQLSPVPLIARKDYLTNEIVPDKTIDTPDYKVYHVNPELNDYLKTIFNFEFKAFYHIINNQMVKHIDTGRTLGINYLLNSGGVDVTTEFYDKLNPENLLKSVVFPERQWYMLNVSLPHAVLAKSIIDRFAIAITPAKRIF